MFATYCPPHRENSYYNIKLALELGGIDKRLLALTSDPIQMRYALIKLLKLQQGVKLLSLKVLPASAVTQRKTNPETDKIATATVGDIKAQTQQLQSYRRIPTTGRRLCPSNVNVEIRSTREF
jgi:hypothetical protein